MSSNQTTPAAKRGSLPSGSDRTVVWSCGLLLGAALLLTNGWFTAVDDECIMIDQAARPLRRIAGLFLSGAGMNEHPPLYDLILHAWLRLSNGAFYWLRVPSIFFYLLGAWILAKASSRLMGARAPKWTWMLVALWPYGFHFARLAGWYSWSFLLISALTLAYLDWIEQPTLGRWFLVVLCCLLLVYTNYFGWALLACLALDVVLRDPKNLVRYWIQFLSAFAFLLLAYAPVCVAFFREVRAGVHTHSAFVALLTGVYSLYCVFVSESVAPWFWALGVPAGIGVGVAMLLALRCAPPEARRFLLYVVVLLALMSFLGIATTKRIMLLGPWLLLSLSTTLVSLRNPLAHRMLLAALAIAAGIGWYGIFNRTLYAAPHWVEPWDRVARQAAGVVRNGGAVIGNNNSFFFYLTYMLPPDAGATQFAGLLPASTRRQGVYDPGQWLAAGRPTQPNVLLVKGPHFAVSAEPSDEAELWLSGHCMLKNVDRMVRDPGVKWKQRFAPDLGETEWRIEVRAYQCP